MKAITELVADALCFPDATVEAYQVPEGDAFAVTVKWRGREARTKVEHLPVPTSELPKGFARDVPKEAIQDLWEQLVGKDECGTCRFYEGLRTRCRRHAPAMSSHKDWPAHGAWPETATDDWCGDYERSPNRDPNKMEAS